MANANISAIQVTNTFDEWRVATNDLIQDRNILRNKTYVKDESDLQLANGALTLSRSTGGVLLTITGSGGALVGGTTTTSDLTVQDDASVANNLTVSGNVIASGNVSVGRNVNVAMELAVTGNVSVNTDKFTINSNTGDVTLKGDLSLDGGDIVSLANANVVNTSSETVNFGGAAATVRVGSTSGTTILRGKANIASAANLLSGVNVAGALYVAGESTLVSNAYFNSNVNVTGGIFVTGNSTYKNVSVANIATVDNAYITTLTLTNPIIGPFQIDANSFTIRAGSSVDGEGFFRVRRSVASGNVDIWWDDTDDTWKFVRNYPTIANERANLSATLKSVRDFVINTTATATQTVDLSLSNWFRYTLNQNTTIQFANAPASGVGITATLLINQDGTGSRTLTFANTVYFANGSPPTPSTNANSEDMWTFTTYDGGQSFIGALAIKDSFVRRIPDGLIEYMIVGGGAGGGLTTSVTFQNDGGGGGGGGGVLQGTSLNIASNTAYTITVGSGGAAGYSLGLLASGPIQMTETPNAFNGANGGNSSISASAPFTTITAAGGGAGGGSYTYPGMNPGYVENGAVGGSGGGGGMAAYDKIIKTTPRSSGGGSRNIPWNIDLPYTFSTPAFANRRDIIFGGNATTNAAQTAWTAYWDSANDHFFMTFASPGIGGGVGAGLGGAGNTPSTSPAQGYDGGRAGYLYTNNLHSTVWNTMPGYIGNENFGTNPNLPAIPDSIAFERVYAFYAFIVGGVGRGGGGGAGGVGENGADLQFGPPYGGLRYNSGYAPSLDPLNNPSRGQPAVILAGSQKGGNGGIGLTSTISGSSVIYGAGGGGYGFSIAGLGGGGVSANGAGNAGTGGHFTYEWGNTSPSATTYTGNNVVFAGNGTTNRGGGGGAGACKSGAGGSGVVIIRYPIRSVNGKVLYIPASSNTGSPTYTESGGYRIYTFTGSGSITWTV